MDQGSLHAEAAVAPNSCGVWDRKGRWVENNPISTPCLHLPRILEPLIRDQESNISKKLLSVTVGWLEEHHSTAPTNPSALCCLSELDLPKWPEKVKSFIFSTT